MEMNQAVHNCLEALLNFCSYTETEKRECYSAIKQFLNSFASQQFSTNPQWQSFITDDHSPVEFSITFSTQGRPIVRMLGEPIDNTCRTFSDIVKCANRFILEAKQNNPSLNWTLFDILQSIFLEPVDSGKFYMWYGIDLAPGVYNHKIYFNPQLAGPSQKTAQQKVEETFAAVGINAAEFITITEKCGVNSHNLDFVAFDLGKNPRLKVYIRLKGLDTLKMTALIAEAFPSLIGTCSEFWEEFCCNNLCNTPRTLSDAVSASGLIVTLVYSIDKKSLQNIKLHFPLRFYYLNDSLLAECTQTFMKKKKFIGDVSSYKHMLEKFSFYRNLQDRAGIQTVTSFCIKGEAQELTTYISGEFCSRVNQEPTKSSA